MMGWLKISAVIAAFGLPAAVWISWDHEHRQRLAAEASLVQARASLAASERRLQAETKIQAVIRTVYVKAAEGEAHVKTIDPKCSAGGALVADFRLQLDRLRQPAASSDPAAAVGPDPLQGR